MSTADSKTRILIHGVSGRMGQGLLRLASGHAGLDVVAGTTGLDSTQRDALERASSSIAVLWEANFSLGVAVLNELVERAAKALPGWDCGIVDSHNVHTKDAPSAT